MKVVLNIDCNGAIKEGDIVVYRKGKWVAMAKEQYLDCVVKENIALNNRLDELQTAFNNFKVAVNKVLKDHHEVLQIIAKENE